jgi:hypothetical protein
MLISELIESLAKLKEANGDLPVCYYNNAVGQTIDIDTACTYPKNKTYKKMYNTEHKKWVMLI